MASLAGMWGIKKKSLSNSESGHRDTVAAMREGKIGIIGLSEGSAYNG